MSDLPQDNKNEITKLNGKLDVLKVKVEGEMKSQSENIKAIKESVKKIEEASKSIEEKTSHNINRLFQKSDDHGKRIASVETKQVGHETLSESRNLSVHQRMNETKKELKETIEIQFKALSDSMKEGKISFRWIIGIFLTLAAAVVSALFAMHH